ncbi:MAG: histidinol-phosphate transaminase [Candidatus Marinimicrobia bacterium]|nr:histidinol-phosphate transaminase [Candidatus Neomarinimicrobiota bacterium]
MPLVPKYIDTLAPYQPGKPVEELLRSSGASPPPRIIKLASNESPLGPSQRAIKAAKTALAQSHRYPDPSVFELRTALAQRFEVQLDNVIAGAGSEGIMSTIMRTFLCDEDDIVSARGTFLVFRVLADASGRLTHWVPMQGYRYDLPALAEAINEYTKIVYLANPDNPTGTYFTVGEFDAFMERVPPRVLVILDEAYVEFARDLSDYPDSMHYRYDNVITLRTFSKAYGLAGLRVGYGFAHDQLIGNLLKVKLPFEPSRPAQAAALAALEDEDHLKASIANTHTGMATLTIAFDKLGLDYIPSAANFVTLKLPSEQAATDFTTAMLARGVILRHLASFGWPDLVRVTVGLPDENEYFVEQLEGD